MVGVFRSSVQGWRHGLRWTATAAAPRRAPRSGMARGSERTPERLVKQPRCRTHPRIWKRVGGLAGRRREGARRRGPGMGGPGSRSRSPGAYE
eukprot:3015065-Pyramimonas_sp.AAC.1